MGVTGIILLYQGVFQTGGVTQRAVTDIRAIMSYNPAIGETGSTLLKDLHSHHQSLKKQHIVKFLGHRLESHKLDDTGWQLLYEKSIQWTLQLH